MIQNNSRFTASLQIPFSRFHLSVFLLGPYRNGFPLKNTDLQAGICFGKAHRTMQGSSKKGKIPQSGICPAPCVLCLFTVVFAWKCRLFCLCRHGQCRVHYIYHVEFHFWFRHLVSIWGHLPFWGRRLLCLCAYGPCRVYHIYHMEFHFRFGHLVSFPV